MAEKEIVSRTSPEPGENGLKLGYQKNRVNFAIPRYVKPIGKAAYLL